MREIKFRAWNKEKKKMLSYGELFNIDCSGEYPFLALVAGHYENALNPLSVKIMQFTGLQDKNSVDIYEGDIITYDYMFQEKKEVCEVKWNIDKNGFFAENEESQWWIERELKNQFEVIGNIYENSELMET